MIPVGPGESSPERDMGQGVCGVWHCSGVPVRCNTHGFLWCCVWKFFGSKNPMQDPNIQEHFGFGTRYPSKNCGSNMPTTLFTFTKLHSMSPWPQEGWLPRFQEATGEAAFGYGWTNQLLNEFGLQHPWSKGSSVKNDHSFIFPCLLGYPKKYQTWKHHNSEFASPGGCPKAPAASALELTTDKWFKIWWFFGRFTFIGSLQCLHMFTEFICLFLFGTLVMAWRQNQFPKLHWHFFLLLLWYSATLRHFNSLLPSNTHFL